MLNDNQNEELPHDITRDIACTLMPYENEMLIIPDHFDGVIYESAFAERTFKNIKANNITQIKSGAFYACRSLVEVDFPSVNIIDDEAFNYTMIEILKLPKLETISSCTFTDMEKLKAIHMYNLKNITNTSIMFELCPNLEEIRIGNEEIGREILNRLDPQCEKVRIYIGDSDEPINENFSDLTDIYTKTAQHLLNSEYYVDGTLTIPENFNGMIANNSFITNESIKSINFNNIKIIGDNSFNGCKNLIEVYGDKVTKIDVGAFCSCGKLNKINFPNVNEIFNCAFSYCKDLTQISFPNIQLIDSRTFHKCEKLQQVQLPSVTEIKNSAFSCCSNLENIDLPNAETIGNGAFSLCGKLHEINIPKVSTLGPECFSGCESLTEIKLPSMINFGRSSSQFPSSLKKIYIPSIESFNKSIFEFCWHLEEIITGTPEQCELIFNNIDEVNRRRLINGTCKLFYEGEVWDCQAYLEQLEAQRRQERERLIQENQQIIDNFFEAFKTAEDDIKKDEICPICQSKFNELESGNFVCTMHEDPKSRVQHQICKDCFFGLIKFNDYTSSCPMCKENLGIPDDVIKAIKAITELEQQDNN